MIDKPLKDETKMFKAGNSWSFRVTSKDRKSFKKLEAADPSVDAFMDEFYKKHGDLMKELEDK
ncbi:AbrB family transcriptional regulator [uncultured Lactobacillus sp.]|uniref:AbrB family transcriptional regulator n=1 Tax=uncultured Lactobacillus sp. TaxID=153152 RepID=UPI00261AA3EE|nr:AbrB family transcriptional regulator [uncultured Lactobacillus sp.]